MKTIQNKIEELLQQLATEGLERGVQLAVYYKGELIVDAWAGTTDATGSRQVNGETLFPVFSVSKGITATLAHILAERGLINYDEPIAKLWPEFAAHGKESITLRHALSHTSGIPLLPAHLTAADIVNWKKMCSVVADLPPVWTPGQKADYHSITYGWIVGETLCRATGQSFPRLLEEEIIRPLGLNSMFIGMPANEESKAAIAEDGNTTFVPTHNSQPTATPECMQPLDASMSRSDMRQACLPASGGMMNARALARHYASLLPGGVDGVELLPPERIRVATIRQPVQEPAGEFSTWALGYHQIQEWQPPAEIARVFGHGGYGGSIGFADLDRKIAVGFTRNFYQQGDTRLRIFQLLRDVLP